MISKHINDAVRYIDDNIPHLVHLGVVKDKKQENDIPENEWVMRIVPNIASTPSEMIESQSQTQKKSMLNQYASYNEYKNDVKGQIALFNRITQKEELERQKAKLAELNARLNNALFTTYLDELKTKLELYEKKKVEEFEENIRKQNEAIAKSKEIEASLLAPAQVSEQIVNEEIKDVENEIIDEIQEDVEPEPEPELEPEPQPEPLPEEIIFTEEEEEFLKSEGITIDENLTLYEQMLRVKPDIEEDPDVPTSSSYLLRRENIQGMPPSILNVIKKRLENKEDVFLPNYELSPYQKTSLGVSTQPSSESQSITYNPMLFNDATVNKIKSLSGMEAKIEQIKEHYQINKNILVEQLEKYRNAPVEEKEKQYNKILINLRLAPQNNIGRQGRPIFLNVPYDIAENEIELAISKYSLGIDSIDNLFKQKIENPKELGVNFIKQVRDPMRIAFKIGNTPEYYDVVYKKPKAFLEKYHYERDLPKSPEKKI